MKLFTGPGKCLIVPTEWVDYDKDDCPICKDNIEQGLNRYTGRSSMAFPHGYYKKIEVPFGHWYTDGADAQVVRPWTMDEVRAWMKETKL